MLARLAGETDGEVKDKTVNVRTTDVTRPLVCRERADEAMAGGP
jgi:hypothetical protein